MGEKLVVRGLGWATAVGGLIWFLGIMAVAPPIDPGLPDREWWPEFWGWMRSSGWVWVLGLILTTALGIALILVPLDPANQVRSKSKPMIQDELDGIAG